MRAKFNKNKGTTLIEVLISITIFSLISIPLSMMVISAVGNNKKGESKQEAVAVAQQIIEQLRANNTTIPGIVTIKTDKTYDLNFDEIKTPSAPSAGHDIGYKTPDEDVGNGFTAAVTFERKLPYDSASTNTDVYDITITMGTTSITVKKGTDTFGDTTQFTDNLEIINDTSNTIKLQKFNDATTSLGSYHISHNPNIKIEYATGYGTKEIDFQNDATDPLSVYIFNKDSANANTCKNVGGSIKFYDDLSSSSTHASTSYDSNSGIYDINVVIYKGEGSNKVKVYNTNTSINIGT